MHIEFLDNERYSATEISTVTFKRDLGYPLCLKGFMFSPGLKKNLIFVEFLEDFDYFVIFSKGKAFLRHIVTKQVKHIGFQFKNPYKLELGEC